jgi:hypothetical protein
MFLKFGRVSDSDSRAQKGVWGMNARGLLFLIFGGG